MKPVPSHRFVNCFRSTRCSRCLMHALGMLVVGFLSHSAVAGAATPRMVQLTSNEVGEVSVRLRGDDRGRLHIAYSRGGQIYYQCLHERGIPITPEEWVGAGEAVSLAVDSQGHPHIATIVESQIQYSTRNSGTWISSSVGPALEVSLDIAQTNQPYVAYTTTNTPNGRAHIRLARVTPSGLANVVNIFQGSVGTYSCDGNSATEHHDFSWPVLRFKNGAFHIAARQSRQRASFLKPGGPFCPEVTDRLVAFANYAPPSLQTSTTDWSPYRHVLFGEGATTGVSSQQSLVIWNDGGQGFLAQQSGSDWPPVSLHNLYSYGVSARAIDVNRFGKAGFIINRRRDGGTELYFREDGMNQYAMTLSEDNWGDAFSMDYLALTSVREDANGHTQVFLLHRFDSAGDGIDDAWALRHYGVLTLPDPDADTSLEGFTIRDAYISNTDPHDPQRSFVVEQIAPANWPDALTIRLPGEWGRLYTVESAPSPDGPWNAETNMMDIPGAGAPLELVVMAEDEVRFFRVTVRLAP